jgi:transcriptional regulator with XRE-family HTH domain
MSLGKKLKQLRKEKGWSQDELAANAGIDGRQISRYENDRVVPSVDVVIKIAKAYDVSLDFLLLDQATRRPLQQPLGRLAQRVLSLRDLSEDDERSLLHMLEAIEAKNRLKQLAASVG